MLLTLERERTRTDRVTDSGAVAPLCHTVVNS